MKLHSFDLTSSPYNQNELPSTCCDKPTIGCFYFFFILVLIYFFAWVGWCCMSPWVQSVKMEKHLEWHNQTTWHFPEKGKWGKVCMHEEEKCLNTHLRFHRGFSQRIKSDRCIWVRYFNPLPFKFQLRSSL